MPDDAEFWDFYWESRLLPLENLGKRQAILAASRLIRNWRNTHSNPMRVMELGCGEAQVIGALLDAHADLCNTRQAAGVDYNPASLAQCRRNYPTLKFLEGDITDADFMAGLGQYDLVLLVNALHEVFSSVISPELGEVDVPAAKAQVETALTGAVQRLAPGGWLLLFDGLEPPGDLHTEIAIRFADAAVFSDFEMFARQYQPFKIAYRRRGALGVVLSRRDFTRYLTKSIFLRKPLWQKEQKESYQYFTEEEFCTAISRQGLHIVELQTLTVDGEKWRSLVEIETPGEDFPQEHILILAQLSG